MPRPTSLLAATAAAVALAPLSLAQTPLSGNLTGTLAAGVYVVNGNLTVPLGQTATFNPGVILKFTSAYELTVNGTLLANGTVNNPIILTDYRDDSAGGDTNNNGPSSGGATAWRGIVMNSTASASVLQFVDARYGGNGYISNFHLNACNATFRHCTSRHNYTHGMNLGNNSFPTITDSVFHSNGGNAIEAVPVNALANCLDNTANSNGTNIARVTAGTVAGTLSLGPRNLLNGVLAIQDHLTIPAGATLELTAGAVVKPMSAYEVTVNGTLRCLGTSGARVVFTDFRDDSAGGDTNNNGASSGGATAWRGIVFNAGASGSLLTWTEARYGGNGYVSNFHLTGGAPTFQHCGSLYNYTHGMQLSNTATPVVSDCWFQGNGGRAMDGVPIMALAGFTNNTASGNGANFAGVSDGTLTGNLTLGVQNLIGGVLAAGTHVIVPVGMTLTLGAGVVVKPLSAYEVNVQGTLITNGTSGAPVVFTDYRDDSAGGDTNNNGPSAGGATAWRGIVFGDTADASVLTWTEARYGGNGYVSNFHLGHCDATFANCTSYNNYTHGMQLSNNSFPTVTNCSFVNNGGNAVEGVAIAAVPGFTNNSASGNSGNFLHVTAATVNGFLNLGPQSILNGALAMQDHLVVNGALRVEQGVAFKFQGGYEVTVNGIVDLRGTSYEPVAFTDFADDSIAGDTNNNGPSSGGATGWRGMLINPGAAACRLENVLIRHGGSGYAPGLSVQNAITTLRSVRVDQCYSHGFVLAGLGAPATNLIAWQNGGNGIHLTGGTFEVLHATCQGNSVGLRAENAWTGYVRNSISYANGSNFSNFGIGTRVTNCNGGFAGSQGNLNVDPQFVAASNGDLHLQATSPCLGVGDFTAALVTVKDHDETPRALDHALVGIPAPDLGAYERAAWEMAVAGQARPGHTVTFTMSGPAGDSFLGMGVLDGTLPVWPFGTLLAGAVPGSSVALLYPVPLPVGFPIPLPLANSNDLLGYAIGFQSLTLPTGSLSVGNLTRLHRMLIRP